MYENDITDTRVYPFYVNKTNYYKRLYGENTVVLMQVGSFYEVYSNCDDDNIDIKKISDLTQLAVANKKCGYYMAGFKVEIYNKYVNILTNSGYTCVIYHQTGEQTIDGKEERKLKEIISPGTNINCKNETSNLIVFYFEKNNNFLSLGSFIINILTNKCFILESHSNIHDNNKAINDILRIITTHKPTEVLLISLYKLEDDIKNILELFDVKTIIHNKLGEMKKDFTKLEYQRQLLIKAYNHIGMQDIISYLNLDHYPIALIALINGIQFIYERNPEIIKNIEKPKNIDKNDILKMDYDSALQLNYIDDKEKSVLKIINKCITAIGRRAMDIKLTYPSTNIKNLKRQYDNIENLINEDLTEPIKHLKQIFDIERIYRKIVSNKLNISEWSNFDISMKHIRELFNFFDEDTICIDEIEKKYECLDLENLNNDNPFKKNYYEELDILNLKYDENYKKLNEIIEEINNIGTKDSTQCKLEITKDLIFITMTKRRYQTALKLDEKLMKSFETETRNKDNFKITNNNIRKIISDILDIKNELVTKSNEIYKLFIKSFGNDMFDNINKIINDIGIYDILICNVNNAIKYNLTKPIIKKNESSYFKVKGIRNPIIEYQQLGCIKNDLELGENGLLLYGVNSSGKSCLMKSVAINILLAQSGQYVFCDKLELSPYNALYTRISSSDNIFRKESSFIREMYELDNILRRVNNKSLVVGDEVCCGTENTSAISIVAATLLELVESKCSFLFATHLHELTGIKEIKESKEILIKHMMINISNDNIIFERKLLDGEGHKLYGVNICRYLKMPEKFLLNAERFRKELCNEQFDFLNLKKSNYNSKIYMDLCIVCNKNKATETHHIVYQSHDNSKQMNNKNNLVQICEECHNNEHINKNIKIEGYIDTILGRVLKVNSL